MICCFFLILSIGLTSALKPSDTIPGYLKNDYGIDVQEHEVTTEDGYILTAFRIPRPGAPVVLLQHGILSSAWCWIDNTFDLSPGLQLYRAGFDVWLTNSRGNTFSRKHTELKPSSRAFWNFTFAKMGRYDVPANVRYILNTTLQPSLTFVGWSQGSSQFFIAMQDLHLKAELQRTVNLFVALSPVTRMGHAGGILKSVSNRHMGRALHGIFPYGILTQDGAPRVAQRFCELTRGKICKFTVNNVCGTSPLDNPAAITNMTAHFPTGVSVKGLAHYEQFIREDRFGDFDYGARKNLEIYGQKHPPDFDISNLSIPTALFAGTKDTLADPVAVAKLVADNRHNPNLVFHQTFDPFSHVTWFVGKEAAFYVWYPQFLEVIRSHAPPNILLRAVQEEPQYNVQTLFEQLYNDPVLV